MMSAPSNHISLEDERQLIEKSKKDIRFFEPLYEKYFSLIYRYIFRRTDDEALAADLCATTFYKVLVQLKKFEWQGKPLAAWLYRIAQNEVKKYFRDRKRIFVIEEDKLLEAEFSEDWKQVNLSLLNDELMKLSELDLQLIELRFFEGLTFQEMAAILELGESAVKMKLYRLLSKLKSSLEAQYARI